MRRAQLECYGVAVNTFYEVEPAYCDYYRLTECKQGWFAGPVALARRYESKKSTATATETEERHECLNWLDGKEDGSVVFVCFGSWCRFKDEQLKEIAVGFERSGRQFLWVVRKGKWMPDEGWEKRVEGEGMVVRGWAPQVEILGHKAVGAFLTHYGWNSVLEVTAAGVPMLTWPLVFEQFINERLAVEVLGVGQRVSEGFRSTREEEKVVLPAEAIAKVVSEFTEKEGSEGRMRMEAKKYAAMASAAVADGGSSGTDLCRLIGRTKSPEHVTGRSNFSTRILFVL